MSISDKVVAAEEAATNAKDTLVELTKAYEVEETPEGLVAIDEQTEEVEKAVAQLETYRRAEAALASKAQAVAPAEAPSIIKSSPSSILKEPADYLFANAMVTLEAQMKRLPFSQVLESRFGENDELKAVSGVVQKYTDTPPLATTFTETWAAELTREGVGQFLDLLTPDSIVPRLPLQRMSFGGNNTMRIPMRDADPTMDADFIGEGDPIPVKAAGLSSKILKQQKMAVIGTYTTELFERSTPNILNVIRNAVLRDTAIKLDTAFLSDLVGSDIQPPGMQSLVTTPIDGSGMTTQAGAIAAIKAAIVAMSDNMLGARPAWVMHPSVAWSLQMMQTAVGQPAFPEMANGQLVGIPVYTSITVPSDLIFLIDCAEIVFAYDGPRFMASDQATLHMAAPAAMISDNTGENGAQEVASPVRNLYQTDTHALRTIWHLTWDQMRTGSVVLINDVAV